jgi:hypothetical protein
MALTSHSGTASLNGRSSAMSLLTMDESGCPLDLESDR